MIILRILRIILMLLIAAVVGLTAVWHVFRFEERLRFAALDLFRSAVGENITFHRLSLGLRGVKFGGCEFAFADRFELSVPAVTIGVSPWIAIFKGIKAPGAITGVTVKSPRLVIAPGAPPDRSKPHKPFPPYPLKPLAAIAFIPAITIIDGEVIYTELPEFNVDSISGLLEISPDSVMTLNMRARVPILDGSILLIDGLSALAAGGFDIQAEFLAQDMSAWRLPAILTAVDSISGKMRANLHLRAMEKLHIDGGLEMHDVSAFLGESIRITGFSTIGELVDQRFVINGSLALNGLNLPFQGEVADLSNLAWTFSVIRDDVNLSELNLAFVPDLAGRARLEARFSGDGTDFKSQVTLNAKSIAVSGVQAHDVNAVITGRRLDLGLEYLSAQLFDGDMKISGLYQHRRDSLGFKWRYRRKFKPQELEGWCAIASPSLSGEGWAAATADGWSGSGEMVLIDEIDDTLMEFLIELKDEKIIAVLTSPELDDRFTLLYDLSGGGEGFDLSGKNPQGLFSKIAKPELIPDFLKHYDISIALRGQPKHIIYALEWHFAKPGLPPHHGSAEGVFSNHGIGSRDIAGDLDLSFANRMTFHGIYQGQWQDDHFLLKEAVLEDERGVKVLSAHGSLGPRLDKWDLLNVNVNDLPYFEFIRMMAPELALNLDGRLNGRVIGGQNGMSWSLDLSCVFPDSSIFTGESAGSFDGENFLLKELTLSTADEGHDLLSATLRYNVKNSNIDSLMLTFDQLPIKLLAMLTPKANPERLGGFVNGRLTALGAARAPELSADFHLTGGLINAVPGYWGNLRIVTLDSLYKTERFDFGRKLAVLGRVLGQYNRFTGAFKANLSGSDIDIQNLLTTITDKHVNLRGRGKISCDIERENGDIKASAQLDVSDGYLGPLRYDSFQSWLTLENPTDKNPSIGLDSGLVKWSDVRALVKGKIPLAADDSLTLDGHIDGRLLELLYYLDPYFTNPRGNGGIEFKLGGTATNPKLNSARLRLSNGGIRMTSVVRQIENLNLEIALEDDGRIAITDFAGQVEGQPFRLANRFPAPPENISTIKVGDYDFGVIQFSTGSEGIWTVIPGLMQRNWGGFVAFSGHSPGTPFEISGPSERLHAAGRVSLHQATFTFPFLPASGKPSPAVQKILGTLQRMVWDTKLVPERGNSYVLSLSGIQNLPLLETLKKNLSGPLIDVDVKVYLDLLIDESNEGLTFSESLDDSFRVAGELTSTRGSIEYLDISFDIEKLSVRFSSADIYPILSGSAKTEVQQQIGGETYPREVRLTIRSSQGELGDHANENYTAASASGAWGDISIVLEDDLGHSQEEILALLGYSPETLPTKLSGLGGKLVENVTPLRDWTRTIERRMERWLGLDQFELDPTIARNLIERQLYPSQFETEESGRRYNYLAALDRSRVTVGKYLARGLFLSYSTALAADYLTGSAEAYSTTRLEVVHTWDVLLRLIKIAPNLLLNYRYEYDGLSESQDNRFFVRYSLLLGL